MKRHLGGSFWVESVLGWLTAFLTILTLVWGHWVEEIFGFDPDNYSGVFEWGLVIVCGIATIVFGFLARRQWQKALLAYSASSP
jgi:hypothetical protein